MKKPELLQNFEERRLGTYPDQNETPENWEVYVGEEDRLYKTELVIPKKTKYIDEPLVNYLEETPKDNHLLRKLGRHGLAVSAAFNSSEKYPSGEENLLYIEVGVELDRPIPVFTHGDAGRIKLIQRRLGAFGFRYGPNFDKLPKKDRLTLKHPDTYLLGN